MNRSAFLLVLTLLTGPVAAQPPRANPRPPAASPKPTGPRLTPIAETKLLMEGMTNTNYLGLERILAKTEIDGDSWVFARGQALLIAESGNLLMLRPPKNSGQDVWMKTAGELRDSAGQLARVVAARDVERSRLALVQLSQVCNSCHTSFRVSTRITPFEAPKP